jgi:hypothetical protein
VASSEEDGVKTAPKLDLYQAAYLAGGRDRVVDTALVVLVSAGRVRVTAPGELATVDLTRRHPVEAAVLDAIGPAGFRSVETIRWRLSTDQRLDDLVHGLQDDGLINRSRHRTTHPDRLPKLATRVGILVLEDLRHTHPPDDAWRVALDGLDALPDQQLRSSIFEQPPSRVTLETGARAPHQLDHAEGLHAAIRAQAEVQGKLGRSTGYSAVERP